MAKSTNMRSANPAMLRLAREAREMTQAELADRLGVRQAKVSKMEAALLPISEAETSAIAAILDFGEELFYWQDRVYGYASHEMFHRRRQKVGVRTLARIHAELNIREMQLERLLHGAEVLSEDSFVRIDPDEYDGDVERVAASVRAAWKLPRGPVENLVDAIESAGGIIIPHDFQTVHVDAVSQWLPHLPPVFFINARCPVDRLRMTLAHEIAHIVMHRTIVPEAEKEAARFAAEFLMPADDIGHQLYEISLPRLADLKAYWKVSMAALLVRARTLHTVTERQYRRFWMKMSQLGFNKKEPVELPTEEPRSFRELLRIHQVELDFTLPELAHYIAENHIPELLSGRRGRLTVVA
jgi:Zn-dependent peptidase ImmA (M78 family)/transcriptional regulator with XRE-family HTH domain